MLQRQNAGFAARMTQMSRRLENGSGVLVYFPQVERSFIPSEAELKELLPLSVVTQNADATIYKMER
jgi:hypothetical protein